MKFVARRKPEPIINVINMVDVFLTLLIFFMMTTTFSANYGIKINLPKSGVSSATISKKPLTLYITKTGAVFYQNKQISEKDLNLLFKNIKAAGGNPTVIIKADNKSTAGNIVNVMGLSLKHGFYKIAIATKK